MAVGGCEDDLGGGVSVIITGSLPLFRAADHLSSALGLSASVAAATAGAGADDLKGSVACSVEVATGAGVLSSAGLSAGAVCPSPVLSVTGFDLLSPPEMTST